MHYYFADHLGTTAVVTNSTGSLPFDEDLDYYPYGGIVAGSTDNVPQNYKFNGKERDAESGLDNFGARFDASTLGRFMTPDWAAKPTTVPYANFGNPQSLNLYSFVENNPTTFRDPDGHYECAGNKEQCAAIRAGLTAIKAADAKLKPGSSGKALLDKAISFYGEEGKKNGVEINFSNTNPNAVGSTSTEKGVTTISFGKDAFSSMKQPGKGETVAHEGTHGVDQRRQGMPKTFWQAYDTEYHAYQGESAVDRGLGVRSESDGDRPVWAPGMSPIQRTLDITRNAYSNAELDCENGACQ